MSNDTGMPRRTKPAIRRMFLLLGLAALGLGACSGPSVLMVGESVRPPEPPPPVFGLSILADDDLTPLAAALTIDGEALVADAAGRAMLTWLDDPIEVTASSPGFHPVSITVDVFPEDGPVELRLAPVVLSGTIIGPAGNPLPGTTVTLGEQSMRTADDGEFRFIRAVPGEVEAARPAWEPAAAAWDGTTESVSVEMEPKTVRALRVDARRTGDPDAWQELLALADGTEINALVIDTKDERGNVYHDTDVATAHEIGAVQALYDLDRVLQDMDDHGLYKITRIVTFQDPWMAPARPAIAATNRSTGGVWETHSGRAWLDPTDRDAWEYPLALAEEACERGFDEIQFDYVRFPSDGPLSEIRFDELVYESRELYYNETSQTKRVETIAAFLETAHDLLNPMGCAVAADIFAITLESSTDEGIGQSPGQLASSLDVISPMIYPSHYGSGWKGYDNPIDHGPEIVEFALDAGIERLQAASGFAIYRPWLERAFLDSAVILETQQVAEDRDLGWMLWSANTQFDTTMLEPAGDG